MMYNTPITERAKQGIAMKPVCSKCGKIGCGCTNECGCDK